MIGDLMAHQLSKLKEETLTAYSNQWPFIQMLVDLETLH
jgi:hypothetical protein